MIEEAVMKWFGLTMMLVLLGLMVGLGTSVYRESGRYEEFIQECSKDHKKYECQAMYKQIRG